MKERFTSILHPIAVDPGFGRIANEIAFERHVDQLIRQVLFTAPGERINRPDFGCGLRRMLFAPNDDATASLLQITVIQALQRWLGPVIDVDEVKVSASAETLSVRIAYVIKARQARRYLNVEVTP